MPIPANLTMPQSDAIESNLAILHAAVQGAVHLLGEAKENRLAFGLQNACRNLEEAVQAIWDRAEGGDRPGCADRGRAHYDPCECPKRG